jgi:hypothetical protein
VKTVDLSDQNLLESIFISGGVVPNSESDRARLAKLLDAGLVYIDQKPPEQGLPAPPPIYRLTVLGRNTVIEARSQSKGE